MKSIQLTLFFAAIAAMVAVPHICLANISVECGQALNSSDGTLSSRAFLISSEDDQLVGAAGRMWHLYDAHNLEIRNASLVKKSTGDLVLAIGAHASGNAKDRVTYNIQGWGDESFTTATLILIDGLAPQSQSEPLQCVVTQD